MSRRAQSTGLLLMVGAGLELLFFLYGVGRRSYMALALPVMAALAALTFWMGWTMYATEDGEEGPAVRPAQ